MTESRSFWWGIILIVVGVLLLVGSWSGEDIGELIRTWWPVLLIVWGVSIVLRRGSSGGASGPTDHPSASLSPPGVADAFESEMIRQTSVFGDVSARVTFPSFRGGTVSTVFGDLRVDLSNAGLADGEHRLKLSGVFGDAAVIVPPGTSIQVSAGTLFGDARVVDRTQGGVGASIRYESEGYRQSKKKLHIEVSQVFGDVSVES